MTTITTKEDLISMGVASQIASRKLSRLPDSIKVQALNNIAKRLESNQGSILKSNQIDLQQAKSEGMDDAMLDRLLLTPEPVSYTHLRAHETRHELV